MLITVLLLAMLCICIAQIIFELLKNCFFFNYNADI